MDAAIVLDALRSPFGDVAARSLPRVTYRAAVRPGALDGARIGVDRRLFGGHKWTDDGLNAVAERAFDTLRVLGATLVDPIEPPDTDASVEDEMTVLLTEFKAGLDGYLANLRRTSIRTLADLIAFNDEQCQAELAYFGQELFEVAEATGGLDDPAYREARRRCLAVTRTDGIDRILAADRLDAIVAPAYGDSSPAAVAGYPSISVPTGLTDDGRPGGVWIYGGFLAEPTLLGLAADLNGPSVLGRDRPSAAGSPSRRPTSACARPRSGRGAAPPGRICHATADRGRRQRRGRPSGPSRPIDDQTEDQIGRVGRGATVSNLVDFDSRPVIDVSSETIRRDAWKANGSRSRSSSWLPDAIVPGHGHENEQLGMVVTGTVTFTVGDETRVLGPGGRWRIPVETPSPGQRRARGRDGRRHLRADPRELGRAARQPTETGAMARGTRLRPPGRSSSASTRMDPSRDRSRR